MGVTLTERTTHAHMCAHALSAFV